MVTSVILVDDSNIFIEGRKHSARLKGVPPLPSGKTQSDPSWQINYLGLLDVLSEGRTVESAIVVGSRAPIGDSLWIDARMRFSVIIFDRDIRNKEKEIDQGLIEQGEELIRNDPEPKALVIASGDSGFLQLARTAKHNGWEVEMCAFEASINLKSEMTKTVNRVRLLDVHFDSISNYDSEWP